ncbi:MAG: sugar phosphate nucleotidyltransferase [bacterium]|nr:sugar phosphate nucleotidyltransferase [bacterium]
MNIVIMAGGGGTRLWPLSRDSYPKQFTQLFGKKTLLQHTFDRALKIAGKPENIVIATREDFAPEVRKQLKRLPKGNIIIESVKRDTAPAIGLAAAYFASKGKHDEVMVSMPSDSYFTNVIPYIKAIKSSQDIIAKNSDALVLIGSKPTYPETGYGYIEMGEAHSGSDHVEYRSVLQFKEKPDLKRAEEFVRAGIFAWNMSVFAVRIGTILELFHKHAPEIAQKLDLIEKCFIGGKLSQIGKLYKTMPKISLDFAVIEHIDAKNLFVISADYGWSDVGHWGSLQELMASEEGLEMKKGIAVLVNSSNNFVYNTAEKAIGLAGVKDLIVVSTPDALLICHKGNVQDVKKVVEELATKNKGKKFI